MSAYRPGYIHIGNPFINQITGLEVIPPPCVPIYDNVVVAGEILSVSDGDLLRQQIDCVLQVPVVIPTTTNEDGTVAPYIPPPEQPPVVVPPPAPPPPGTDPILGVDPLWANVEAMSWMNRPAGTLASAVSNSCNAPTRWPEQDIRKGVFMFSGNQGNIASVSDLPFLGNPTVKTELNQYSGYVETSAFYMITTGGVCGAVASPLLAGNFTVEFMIAADSAAPYIKATMYYDDSVKFLKLNLGNQGAEAGVPIPAQASIMTSIGSFQTVATSGTLQLLHYYHLCIERIGLVVSIYLDGTLIAQTTQTAAHATRGQAIVEARYVSQSRLTAGVARYNGAVSVPSSLFANS